ncbi:MAG: PEP-CTERM sorting domain-containing protein [Gammaproteobacteria bacterium]|nr:PEP-CTERM sorting domain-containing protein [Gammaproteobacteria bacterium]
MNTRLTALAAALISCTSSTWAALPTHEAYSAAIDVAADYLTGGIYTTHSDITTLPGDVANISASDPFTGGPLYAASASTTFGSNHAYTSANMLPLGTLGAISYSGWYDTVTISGGSGTGVMHFTVQLNGSVDAGAIAGIAGYGLYASSVHPTQLANDTIINYAPLPTNPWFLDGNGIALIAGHTIGVSPYNDASLLYTTEIVPRPDGIYGIPALESPQILVDQILAPGAGQNVNVTLHGTLTFTFGEAFYLIGGLGTGLGGIETFCAFSIDGSCTPPPKDGTGATTLDFSNSANLINIALPEGATASFASGTAYNVTAVPEPGEWLMLLAGLGLIAWRTRRNTA